MAAVFTVIEAISAIATTVGVIREVCEKCKLLPECAYCLTQRATAFEVQVKLLHQDKTKMVQFATAVFELKHVLEEIQIYLTRLSKINSKGWMKRIISHHSLVEEYKKLNQRLDTCRDDLQFQFIVNTTTLNTNPERIQQAYEDDLQGLIELSFEEQRSDFAGLKSLMMEMIGALRGIQLQQTQTRGLPPPPPSRVLETAQFILDVSSTGPTSGNELHMELQNLRSQQLARLYIDSKRISLGTKIGVGGFADVYLGMFDQKEVAVKVLRHCSHMMVDEMSALDEIRVQNECSFRHVVQVFGHTKLNMNGNTMIAAVMEHATCGSLAHLLSAATGHNGNIQFQTRDQLPDTAQISTTSLLHVLLQVTLGVEYLHRNCIIHRDIKPSNILLDHQFNPKLCDFGLAKEVVGERSTTRTMTGNVGTIYYMAPEIKEIEDEEDDEEEATTLRKRARYSYTIDVYSVGVVILVACQRLFGGYTRKKVPKSKALPSAFPSMLTSVKDRCLSVIPRERYGRGSNDSTLLSTELSKLYSTNSQATVTVSPNLIQIAASIAQPDTKKKKSSISSHGSGTTSTTELMTMTPTSAYGLSEVKSDYVGRVGEDDLDGVVGSLTPPTRKASFDDTEFKAEVKEFHVRAPSGHHPELLSNRDIDENTKIKTQKKKKKKKKKKHGEAKVKAALSPYENHHDELSSNSVNDESRNTSFCRKETSNLENPPTQKVNIDSCADSSSSKNDDKIKMSSAEVVDSSAADVQDIEVPAAPPKATYDGSASDASNKAKKKRFCRIVVIGIICLGAVLGVVLSLALRRRTNDAEVEFGTEVEVDTGVEVDTEVEVGTEWLSEFIPGVPTNEIQEQALNWMANETNKNDGFVDAKDIDGLLERFVLAVLYFSTNGHTWSNKNGWLSNDSVCEWEGVECENTSRKVRSLDLYTEGLSGELPTELAHLTAMTYLNLAQNSLTGTIPTEFGQLVQLTYLALSFNELLGSIPTELGQLVQLNWLGLYDNGLVGSIPSELGNLSALTSLSLSNNNLTGTVPSEIANLESLQTCHLECNEDLTGIPYNCVGGNSFSYCD